MAIDWDQWRRDYDTMTLQDQIDFYDRVYKDYPSQEFHTADAVKRFLDGTEGGVVAEVGGWTGELAAKMLIDNTTITDWVNLEVASKAILNSATSDNRYRALLIGKFLWEWEVIHGDIFIAAHVIEHMKFAQLDQMMGLVEADHVYFEAPLLEPGQNWDGYNGSHILEVGWDDVHSMMAQRGFELTNFEVPGDVSIAFYRRIPELRATVV